MFHKFLRYLIFSSILFMTSTCFSMGKEPDKMVTFKGQEMYLMNLLIGSYFNHQHPFSITPVIRKIDDTFYHVGDILNLQAHDFSDIHHKNYVYIDNQTRTPTRFSDGQAVRVSLLILGTSDKDSCLQKLKSKESIEKAKNSFPIKISQEFKKLERHQAYDKANNKME